MKTMVASIIKKKTLIKKSAPKALAISTLAGLLAACNNDNDSASVVTPVITSTTLSGAVVKGPLSGALVYADSDGDGIGDGSPITTAADGSYTVSATNANATIIAMSGPNTVDTSSGETLTGITLKAPAGSTVVTPATTILEAQPEIEPAQLAIALGIPTTAADGTPIDIMSFNPYAAGADPAAALAAEKAAQQVMVTIKAVSAAAEGAGMNVEDAFEQAMASVAEVVSVEAEKIDVSSTASIAAAEATMATTKVDFSDSAVLDAVSTAVQTKVVAAAAADDTIVVNTTAFAAVLETAVTAVSNVNAAIEAITDTDLTSTESMGTFATLTDMASEIKAAAVAEVETPGAGAALVTFTDATAVTLAVAEAVVEVEAYVIEVAAAAEIIPVVEVPVVVTPVVAPPVIIVDTASSFVVTGNTGASWYSAATGTQVLDTTINGGILDVTTDVNANATEFKAAFSNSAVDTSGLGTLAITNLKSPSYGSKDNAEVTVVISETGSTGKITVGFTLDWSVSGQNVTVSSDDSSVDITYVEYDNSSTIVNISNGSDLTNSITIENDNDYFGDSPGGTTLNINALALIADLNATGFYSFNELETRFATAGKELDVSVDVSNIGMYFGSTELTTITSTIDIV
jgi:hypothetical protein